MHKKQLETNLIEKFTFTSHNEGSKKKKKNNHRKTTTTKKNVKNRNEKLEPNNQT